MTFEVEPAEAQVVKKVFELYINGWGYKKIANYLTEQNIPTPRMNERARKEAKGEECKIKAKPEWSIVTVQGMLTNDFYIGTLRQGKYTRRKINGDDIKKSVDDQIVFENNHEAIIDYRTFAIAQEALKKRTSNNYRGVKKYDNVYSGLMVCGDCGSPMFPMSRSNLKEAYRCGTYHQRGLKGCTSHHIRADVLDSVVKAYLQNVRNTSSAMIEKLQNSVRGEANVIKSNIEIITALENQLEEAKEERKMLIRQKAREVMRHPEREDSIEESYDELLLESDAKIEGIENQILLTHQKQNTVVKVNRIAKLAVDIFGAILDKDRLDKNDLELIIDKIYVYEDHIHIKLKDDIECILKSGTLPETEQAANFERGIIDNLSAVAVQTSNNRKDKVYDVNIISNGDPLEIYTNSGGEVIFKKYSPIGELSSFAAQYADALTNATDLTVLICDRDHCIAASGISKKEVLERRVTQNVEDIMEGRRVEVYPSEKTVPAIEGIDQNIAVAAPIIASGDVSGAVVLTSSDGESAKESDIKLATVAASFLGKQMEN